MPGPAANPQLTSNNTVEVGKQYKSVLLFGAPGAGKGTQGRVLGSIPGFYHFACGDVFRSIDINSELGRIFYEYSSRGQLVPDDVTIKMWAENMHARRIIGAFKPRVDLLVLDGIPRTLEQAKLLDQYIDVLLVMHLHCTDEEAMFERLRRRALKENRFDDADERVIRKRWEVYEAETAPVLAHYPKEKVVEIDSLGSPARVLRDILEVVVPIQDAHFAAFE
ncbi:adenylate kinase family protein [Phycisphaerales bacterium AB-hyl4]|uniref:Adenylate kinase n=1 Tax=Natronomicrosphaera hydrolytica TaxID=3242702 RepID=A0ABV4U1Z2_9BACT